MGDFQSQQKVSRPQTKRARPTTSTRPPNWPISCKKSIILMLLTSRTIFNAILKVPHSFCQTQHFSRRFSLIAYSALPPPNSTRHCSVVVNFKMSQKQKSITSFFAPKATLSSKSSSSDTSGNSANLPTETKSPIKKKELLSDEKKPVHNSPLRPIQNESEVSLDSPIKQTKKQRKRIESSSEEEENGSPKRESPQKPKNVGTKRKSSPSLSGSKPSKKTKDEEKTIEVSPKSPKSPETDSGKKKRRKKKKKKKKKKKTSKSVKKEEDNTEPMDVEKTDTETKSTKVKLPGKKGKKKAEKEELVDELKAL